MLALPFERTHIRTTSSMACQHRLLRSTQCQFTSIVVCSHRPWRAHTVRISGMKCHHRLLKTHTRSNNVGPYMLSTTLVRVKLYPAWYACMAFGQHTRLDDVDVASLIAFGLHTRTVNIERGMTLSPLSSTHSRPTLGIICHHFP